jgi:hypothetical protein
MHRTERGNKQRTVEVPDTSNKPEVNCLRQTTLFPRKRPAKRINTVPGVILDLSLGAPRTVTGPLLVLTSSAG